MADKWPAANGNWSTAANWNGGTKPQPGDDVYADGKAITVDENVSVVSLRTTQRSAGTAGGGFTVSASNITVTATIIAGTSLCLNVTGTNCNVIGNTTGGSGSSTFGIQFTGTATGSLTGNVTGGTGTSAAGISISTSGLVTINGNLVSSVNSAACFHTAGSLVVNGNLLNTLTSTFAALSVSSTLNPIYCTINGDITGATALLITGVGASVVVNSLNPIIGVAATAVIVFQSISTSGAGSLELNVPYVTGGSTLGHYVANFQSGVITLNGNCLASSASPAIVLGLRSNIFINGDVTGTTQPALSVLVGSHGYTINGTVTGGSTAPGIESAAAAGSPCIVIGEVVGGTTSTGYGISNTNSADILVRGTTTNNTAVAIHNTSTGTVTVTSTEREPMEATLTETPTDISGNFGLSVFGIEGAPVYLMKSMGSGTTDFHLYKTYIDKHNGFHDIPNDGTNSWKVQTESTTAVVKVSN